MSHTKGSWRRVAYYVVGTDEQGREKVVADCRKDNGERMPRPASEKECVANADLIATVPEMVDLLEAAVARVKLALDEKESTMLLAWYPQAVRVLKKAKGAV